jgi:tellurium resistance protein TerD
MPISLKKGEKISLTKQAPSLKKIRVGLGWDTRATSGKAFDLDASAFVLGATGKVRNQNQDFVFYGMDKINGKLITKDGSIEHTGDNRTGVGDGDDESMIIDLTKVGADVQRIVFAVTIHEAKERGQSFGQVTNAFIRVVNEEDNTELCRFDISEEASTNTALDFGAVYRKDGEWRFDAIGQGYDGGLLALCGRYGVDAE